MRCLYYLVTKKHVSEGHEVQNIDYKICFMELECKIIKYKNESRIALVFEKNDELYKCITVIDGCKWSNSLGYWHLPDTKVNRIRFKIETAEQQQLNTIKEEKIEWFKRWLKSKRYSDNTLKTYAESLKIFLFYFEEKPIENINNQDIINFNNDYILKKQFSSSYQNQIVNAIKLFYRTIENKVINIDLIHRPKREKLLPNVLSKEEVKLILTAHSNLKHKTMLSLIYSCGLRRSELLQLKFSDIDAIRNIVNIKQSKGKKDRTVSLSPKMLVLLREYYLLYKPKEWLFQGQNKNEPYEARSLSNVLQQALIKTGIKKPVTLQWLRHSYATHLLEGGTDLQYIQELLGHNSSKTTKIYTNVSTKNIQQIKSPFDDL